MNWKCKALVQRFLSHCPFGFHANYFLQRYIQRSLPMDDQSMREMALIAAAHLEAMTAHSPKGPSQATLLEIGAGADLSLPLLFYAQGVNHQITLDITPLARRFLVNSSINRLGSIDIGLWRRPAVPVRPMENLRDALRERFGIDYLAPCDARRTGLRGASIDVITSTNTLEHIPEADIPLILKECRRLLTSSGLLSVYIDYRDHYAYADARISVYNFLRYSAAEWSMFNSFLHYQNRRRHPDYLALADACGFRIVTERRFGPCEADLSLLAALELDSEFRRYALNDLGVQGSHLVLAAK